MQPSRLEPAPCAASSGIPASCMAAKKVDRISHALHLASRFGVADTLIGHALSAMILTAMADFLKFSLARTSQAAATTKVPRRRDFLVRPFRRKRCRVEESVPGVLPSSASSEPIRSDL